ncbi:hypothetical protein FRB96_007166 [Tulasnella sp. 330]|nr:hypothetical protein FRB96_007166 [Tulasnella sp. 330]KAG8878132.1 hypothetical protein FRB97_002814 [Tulasnella sp. 331]KAG8883484.1 hypothetical protein FRB98_003113 [Tulasnella sp. 332]
MNFLKTSKPSVVFIAPYILFVTSSPQRDDPHPWHDMHVRQQTADANGMTVANTQIIATDSSIPTTQTFNWASVSLDGSPTSISTPTVLYPPVLIPTVSVSISSMSTPSSSSASATSTSNVYGTQQITKTNHPVLVGVALVSIFILLNIAFLLHRCGVCNVRRGRTNKRLISNPISVTPNQANRRHDDDKKVKQWSDAQEEKDLSSASMDFHDGSLPHAMARKVSWMATATATRHLKSNSTETLNGKQSDIGEGDVNDLSWEMSESTSASKDSTHDHKQTIEVDYFSCKGALPHTRTIRTSITSEVPQIRIELPGNTGVSLSSGDPFAPELGQVL